MRVICRKEPKPEYVTAMGLMHKVGTIDIYSNSWGNDDDPTKQYFIDHMTEKALIEGATKVT